MRAISVEKSVTLIQFSSNFSDMFAQTPLTGRNVSPVEKNTKRKLLQLDFDRVIAMR